MRKLGRIRSVVAVAAAFAVVGAGAVVVSQGLSSGATDNLIDHSGFRYGAEGWNIEATGDLDVRRTSPGAQGSQYALTLEASSQVDVHLEDQRQGLPKTTQGQVYRGEVYVRTGAAGVSGTLSVRELDGTNVVGMHRTSFTSRTDWTRIVVRHEAKGAGNELLISLDVNNLPGQNRFTIDCLRLVAESTAGGGGGTTDPPVGRVNSGTLFGTSIYQGGTTWDAAVTAADNRYGRLDTIRVFYPGLPSAWPGRAGSVNRPVVVSFKAQPQQVLSGAYDAQLRQWFATAPTDRDIWWSYFHEPEDNVAAGDFTAQQWRDAYRRIAKLAAQADNPSLHSTVILMCWTANPKSGRSVPNFFPGSDVVDTIGWDCYNQTDSYPDPSNMFGRALAASNDFGVGFAVAELGSKLRGGDTGARRADWLRQVGAYLVDQKTEFVTYFDNLVPGGEFRLLDSASQKAWRDIVAW